ncbi:hypothetical protein LCGC14_0986990 [marine sediment metagenome]|uniref:Uncharacterized protein n=1 Tax=marine sediment metagenome TaxID=412755 RepID=A0A0F9RDK8_9ZZZZ
MNNIIIVDYDLIPNEKRCGGNCKKHLPATIVYFYPNMTKGDGLDSKCKQCDTELKKERYQRKILEEPNHNDKTK